MNHRSLRSGGYLGGYAQFGLTNLHLLSSTVSVWLAFEKLSDTSHLIGTWSLSALTPVACKHLQNHFRLSALGRRVLLRFYHEFTDTAAWLSCSLVPFEERSTTRGRTER